MSPVMWPRMRDDYEPGSADPGQSLVKSASQDAWEPGAEPGGGGVDIQVGGSQPSSGWWLDNGQPLPDTVAPSTPTNLTATATGGSTVDLSWTASTDNVAVTGYHYRVDAGTAVDAGAGTSETVTGLSALTAYSFQVRAYDAQGNVSGWSTTATATTLDGPDTTAPTPGTLAASAITSTTFTLTVTGASDEVGLHATPYAFSTDNGATWSAWQAGATYDVTGRTASTAYQARHKVRDAAGNEATGTAITVTTSAPTPLVTDDFNRADTATGGTLGTATTGQTWSDPDSGWGINSNRARPFYNGTSYEVTASITDPVLTKDMHVEVDWMFPIINTPHRVELRVRYDPTADSCYIIQHRSTEQRLLVMRRVGGVNQTLPGGGSHVEVDIGRLLAANEVLSVGLLTKEEGGGTRLIVTVDGVEKLNTLNTAATRPQGTGVGIQPFSDGVRVDNLAVYPA